MDDTNGKHMYPSDRKKLLSLPFLMSKRMELPEPKKGQKEWDLFYDLFDAEWDQFDGLLFDPEEKITEFNYEKFIPAPLLKTMDTQSDDFKNLIKKMNFSQKTQYERHRMNQQMFRELMTITSKLNQEEAEVFLHLI